MHMRTLCCAVYTMSGLGRCSMQFAGGCLIHKLYPLNLTLSVATRSLSAFACWEGPRGKIMCYVIF